MKYVWQVLLMITAFGIAIFAIGYFYHATITQGESLPFLKPIQTTPTPLATPSPTAVPT